MRNAPASCSFRRPPLYNLDSRGHEFFAKTRNGKQSPIRIDAIALSKSPVSLTLGDEVPHIFTRKPRLRPLEFLILGAKRLLQHNQETKRTPQIRLFTSEDAIDMARGSSRREQSCC